ncbi:acetoacetate decarboxylase family protein [Saccharomonospora sp. NB11]|uniref:acetoacetate decarboxylase family protein n=1 Tax=Saccharomonospora sp. NB11 TaxID=1642298 RepID=UPI0018D13B6D|nr:acetoacetate decarboxylase family protein [Saccharomonospora sp. NB11]
MSTDYPDEPWRLTGEAFLSVWSVPLRDLPRVDDVVTPLTVGGRAVVVTAWIDYTPPGQLSYHELLATVAVRSGRGVGSSITEIWVDNETALVGGRELWGIPKDFATFDRADRLTASAATDRDWIATTTFSPCGPSGPTTRVRFRVVQSVDGRQKSSPIRARLRPRPASATWEVNPRGPLGYLAGRRPWLTVQLTDVRLIFGHTQ